MIPSLAYLVEDNTLYFWGLSTQVIHFFNGVLYGMHIMLLPTANKSDYGNITTTVQVVSYRVIQGLSFVAYCAAEIMSANTCAFAFCKIQVFCIGKGKMAEDEVFQLISTAKLRLLK